MKSPADMNVWQGRDDTAAEGPEATRLHQCIKPWTSDSLPGICLLGFACDEGVRRNQGRIGAAEGPTALRKALGNLAWSTAATIQDAGDVHCKGGELEAAQIKLGDCVAGVIQQGSRPIVVGGGHETAWGGFLGLAKTHPDAKIGVVNLDAHFDLRKSTAPHSGTPFRQIADWHRERGKSLRYACLGASESANTAALIRTASNFNVIIGWDVQLANQLDDVTAVLDEFINEVDLIHLSIDLDVLPGWVMPAVSAPAAFGVPLDVIEMLIGRIAESRKLVLADVVEFNPTYDLDGLAGRTAARLVWRLVRTWVKAMEDL